MVGKWSNPWVPNVGWVFMYSEDFGEPCVICEMCEKQEIRYVHYMGHPHYHKLLGCGCVCAGKMINDEPFIKYKDNKLRRNAARKKKLFNKIEKRSSKKLTWCEKREIIDSVFD
jgi:hypothetical protein